jgi:hypothetical protein
MFQKPTFLLLWAATLWATPAWGAAITLARSFDHTAVLTNSPIVVTVSFTNSDTVTVRGFYYADQLPSGLEVTTLNVTLNGSSITNYTFESGQAGDVYTGCTPYRWVLEQPLGFTQTHPIPPKTGGQIVYAINSAAAGTFVLQQFGWIGYDSNNVTELFAASLETDQQTVSFLPAFPPEHPILTISNSLVNVAFPTQSGVTYRIEFKDELTDPDWTLLTSVVGTGGSVTRQDPAELRAHRFYRVGVSVP